MREGGAGAASLRTYAKQVWVITGRVNYRRTTVRTHPPPVHSTPIARRLADDLTPLVAGMEEAVRAIDAGHGIAGDLHVGFLGRNHRATAVEGSRQPLLNLLDTPSVRHAAPVQRAYRLEIHKPLG